MEYRAYGDTGVALVAVEGAIPDNGANKTGNNEE